MTSRSLTRWLAVVAAVLALVAAGCGDDSDDTGGVEVSGAWSRTSPMVADAGAVYMDLEAGETTAVVAASVSDEVAAEVELHETAAMDASDMDDSDMDDSDMAMTMRPVERIELPAGETVSLAPGGLHIMLLGLVEPLEVGDEFDVTLSLESGDELVVAVEVRDEAP
jgi:copper(I)-binding protein